MRLSKAHRLKLFRGSLFIRNVTVSTVLLWTYDSFKGKVGTTATISPRVPIIFSVPTAHLNRSGSRVKIMDVTSGEEELTVQQVSNMTQRKREKKEKKVTDRQKSNKISNTHLFCPYCNVQSAVTFIIID